MKFYITFYSQIAFIKIIENKKIQVLNDKMQHT